MNMNSYELNEKKMVRRFDNGIIRIAQYGTLLICVVIIAVGLLGENPLDLLDANSRLALIILIFMIAITVILKKEVHTPVVFSVGADVVQAKREVVVKRKTCIQIYEMQTSDIEKIVLSTNKMELVFHGQARCLIYDNEGKELQSESEGYGLSILFNATNNDKTNEIIDEIYRVTGKAVQMD